VVSLDRVVDDVKDSGRGAARVVRGIEVPRVLGRFDEGPGDTPFLVCVAGLHGNEPAGVLALERVFAKLVTRGVALAGRFVGLAGNRKALAAGRRFLEQDLNRIWSRPRLARIAAGPPFPVAEDDELAQLWAHLEAVLQEVPAQRRRRIFLLDLHTASGPGPAFTVLDDTLPNRRFALELEVPVVLGIEEELEGTMMHLLCDWGITAVGFEGGRHDDPAAVDRAEAAVWVALAFSGVLAGDPGGEVARSRRLLQEASDDLPRVVEVRHRHAITPIDEFRIRAGVAGFQPVAVGDVLAHDRRGPVTASEPGLVLMPLYQDQGDDGFFLVRPVRPVWLQISAVVRRLRLERVIHWLPGVERHPDRPGSFRVDRRIARWVALELFHLLGFRREGPPGRILVFSRRAGDRS
jgi:succinylglutamate desuccinylase